MKNRQIRYLLILYFVIVSENVFAQSSPFFRGNVSVASQATIQNDSNPVLNEKESLTSKMNENSYSSHITNRHFDNYLLPEAESESSVTSAVRPVCKTAQQIDILPDQMPSNSLNPNSSVQPIQKGISSNSANSNSVNQLIQKGGDFNSNKTPISDSGSKTDNESVNNFSFFRSLISVLGGLAIILGAFFACVLLLKRFSPRRITSIPETILETIGQKALTPRNQLYLIRLGSKLCLVALSPNQINSIAEITDPNEVAQIVEECRKAAQNENDAVPFLEKEFWSKLIRSSKNKKEDNQ
ncbi:MAG: flagellar biosynthetic protein FliO [Planctomycetia bacterium]|nr:flagellar biosynthetic protein FliO [Planctomycetia bacterium]